jgi:hypothetical protein
MAARTEFAYMQTATRQAAQPAPTLPPQNGVILARVRHRGVYSLWPAFLFDGKATMELVSDMGFDAGYMEKCATPGCKFAAGCDRCKKCIYCCPHQR